MNVLLPASRHPALIVFRWSLTVLLSAITVAVIWQALARFQPLPARPQIGLGCTGSGAEATVGAVRTAAEAWVLTHGEPPDSLTTMVETGWMPASLVIPSGCSSPVVFEVSDEVWSVRAPLR